MHSAISDHSSPLWQAKSHIMISVQFVSCSYFRQDHKQQTMKFNIKEQKALYDSCCSVLREI